MNLTTPQSAAFKDDPAANQEASGSVPALDRSLNIVELLSQSPEGMTLSQLSEHLNAPKNSVFRITQTLLARGYVTRNENTLAFRLTPSFLRLAPPRWGSQSLPEVSREAMRMLRDATEETVQLGVLSGREGVIIDQVEGARSLRIVVDLGTRFLLHNNAPGKLLLAYMPPEEQSNVLAEIKLPASTSRTITKKPLLKTECERIVKQGYSTDYAEADDGIHCIAAPIFGMDHEVVGAIWVSGPAKRLPKSRFRELGAKTIAAGNRITHLIGDSA